MDSFVSVYVDWAANEDAVRAATEGLAMPAGVKRIDVATSSDTLGCRVAVDLFGGFDPRVEGRRIARSYAMRLSEVLGVPAFGLADLISTGGSAW
jgi:hypothetical protein